MRLMTKQRRICTEDNKDCPFNKKKKKNTGFSYVLSLKLDPSLKEVVFFIVIANYYFILLYLFIFLTFHNSIRNVIKFKLKLIQVCQ